MAQTDTAWRPGRLGLNIHFYFGFFCFFVGGVGGRGEQIPEDHPRAITQQRVL